MKPPSDARRRTLALQERALRFNLDAWEAVGTLEDEAIELSAIFATIAIKVAGRLEREAKGRRRN